MAGHIDSSSVIENTGQHVASVANSLSLMIPNQICNGKYLQRCQGTGGVNMTRVTEDYIRFNTGKSVAMFILLKLFGTYAVKLDSQLFQHGNSESLNKILFHHKDCLLILIDETDADFRQDIPSLKKITGHDVFANPYTSTFQDQFRVRAMLFFDSNEVLQHRGDSSNGIESRLFLIPFGRPVPREERIWGLEAALTDSANLNTFFSNLLDNHYRRAMSTPLPVKTPAMKRMDMFFRLRQDPVPLFLELATISTESNATMGAQNYITLEVYRFFVRFSKRLYRDLLEKLGFDRTETGEVMTFHQINLELPIEDHREFKAKVDRIMGQANELGRSNKGYRWTSFILKELVIMYLNDQRLEKIYGPMETFVARLDEAKSNLDAVRATQAHISTTDGLAKIAVNGFEGADGTSDDMLILALANPEFLPER